MMTVKEASRLTGISIRTLQYYDKLGLLPAMRTESGYRLYDDAALERLQQILLFRELEFPLRDIRTILDNPNFQGIVPENGVYFDSDAVEFSEGESVLTVLKRCLKSQKIVYNIGADGYVRSIGGLAERDCGAQSGWLYKVNGELPQVSCKYYTLKAGDRVEFAYTCIKGDV